MSEDKLVKMITVTAIEARRRHDVKQLVEREQFEAYDGTPYFRGPNSEIRRLDYKPSLKERKALNAERRRQAAREARARR